MAEALKGDWKSEHLFALKQALETYRHLLKQMGECEQEIEKALAEVVIPPIQAEAPPAPPNPPPALKRARRRCFTMSKPAPGCNGT